MTGGQDSSGTVLNSAELYDPVAQTFTALTATMAISRVGHSAVLLSSYQVLLTGGKDSSGTVFTNAELYDPWPRRSWSRRRDERASQFEKPKCRNGGVEESTNGKLTLSLALILAFVPASLAQDAQSVAPPSSVQPAGQAGQLAGSAPVAGATLPKAGTEPAQLKVILLKPSVRLEDVRSGVWKQGLPGVTTNTPSVVQKTRSPTSDWGYEYILLNAAKSAVGPKTTPLDPETLGPSVMDACTRLEPLASRLARGNVNEEAAKDLASLAALDESYAVLVQFLRVETGPGSAWNTYTGAIASSAASTLIQAALVSGKTGKVIWKGERLIRSKALKPTDAALSKALTELYRDFEVK